MWVKKINIGELNVTEKYGMLGDLVIQSELEKVKEHFKLWFWLTVWNKMNTRNTIFKGLNNV